MRRLALAAAALTLSVAACGSPAGQGEERQEQGEEGGEGAQEEEEEGEEG